MLKVKDLPRNPWYGVAMQCEGGCEGRFSANRGDYFQAPLDLELECRECRGPMMLARERTVVERVEPEQAEAEPRLPAAGVGPRCRTCGGGGLEEGRDQCFTCIEQGRLTPRASLR
jgi:hypothetical protein